MHVSAFEELLHYLQKFGRRHGSILANNELADTKNKNHDKAGLYEAETAHIRPLMYL